MAKVIYPPRPKGAIPPRELDYYEKQGIWCVQYKYNGARCVIHIEGNDVQMIDRHGSQHRSYTLPKSTRNQFLALPGLDKSKEYWLDGELLIKTSATDTKEKIVLFDVLQAGSYLFLGPNQMGRLALLDEICGKPKQLDTMREMSYVVSEDILMAPTFEKDFTLHFNEKIQYDECEGLVLRRKDSSLDNFGTKEYECSWIVRCRKPHKNYNF